MKILMIFSALIVLTACGGSRADRPSANLLTGSVARGCMAADRSAASASLCSCVQRVANSELNSRDRARVATFFADPEVAHAAKISDTEANDAFWRRYQAYVRTARSSCG